MSDKPTPFKNALFELESTILSFSNGSSGKSIGQHISGNDRPSRNEIEAKLTRILSLFDQAERDLLSSALDIELFREHISFLRTKKRQFLYCLLLTKDNEFDQNFRPRDFASNVRILAQLVDNATGGLGREILDRKVLRTDCETILKDLASSQLGQHVKKIIKLNIFAIIALSELDSGVPDAEIRARVREILAIYVSSVEREDNRQSEFSERIVRFVAKYGFDSVALLVLAKDASDTANWLLEAIK